ncbi:MAG: hypothetical protein PVF65_12240 [Sphingomonadales bacterium]
MANNREGWEISVDEEGDEPLEYLIEKLDNSILGLVEALDADSADLPGLIDEALTGSFWARQIVRLAEGARETQLDLLKARSEFIWTQTTAQQRRGHFAMGVGLKAGLTLDGIADELAVALDRADEASLPGDIDVLREALTTLAERLLTIRPFAPDDPLPDNWRDVLSSWLSGTSVREIGPENMRFIEDAFTYRLVWALEALRMRRVALGWQPEIIAGGAAACLETGLPQFLMAMLVRAGLPSRAAAMAAVNDQNPIFVDGPGMIEWLETNEIAALSDTNDWPTAETSEIWREFRTQMLARVSQKWSSREWRRNVDPDSRTRAPDIDQLYRVEIDEHDNSVWICTPDFERLMKLRRTMIDRMPSVLTARFEEGSNQAIIRRLGRSRPIWSQAE